jgi:hypothetical protein
MIPALRKSIRPLVLISFLVTALPDPAIAASQARTQARSVVMTQYGIVATSEVVASQASAARRTREPRVLFGNAIVFCFRFFEDFFTISMN